MSLERLRRAVLVDDRFSTRSYSVLAHHIHQIGRILAPYAKTRKRK